MNELRDFSITLYKNDTSVDQRPQPAERVPLVTRAVSLSGDPCDFEKVT
jgi:hypothetical protein